MSFSVNFNPLIFKFFLNFLKSKFFKEISNSFKATLVKKPATKSLEVSCAGTINLSSNI